MGSTSILSRITEDMQRSLRLYEGAKMNEGDVCGFGRKTCVTSHTS